MILCRNGDWLIGHYLQYLHKEVDATGITLGEGDEDVLAEERVRAVDSNDMKDASLVVEAIARYAVARLLSLSNFRRLSSGTTPA